MVLVGMGFQPGWANGWPMGISKHVVFASFVTTVFLVATVSASAFVISFCCFIAERITKRPYLGWVSFVFAILIVFASAIAYSPTVYQNVRTEIMRVWH